VLILPHAGFHGQGTELALLRKRLGLHLHLIQVIGDDYHPISLVYYLLSQNIKVPISELFGNGYSKVFGHLLKFLEQHLNVFPSLLYGRIDLCEVTLLFVVLLSRLFVVCKTVILLNLLVDLLDSISTSFNRLIHSHNVTK
jgi:hypothetical protein